MGLEGTSSAGTNANCLSAIELAVELAAVELAASGAGVELAAVELTDTATATATGGGPGCVGNRFFLRNFCMSFWVF